MLHNTIMESPPNLHSLPSHNERAFTSFHRITQIEGRVLQFTNEDIEAQLIHLVQEEGRKAGLDSRMANNNEKERDGENPQPRQDERSLSVRPGDQTGSWWVSTSHHQWQQSISPTWCQSIRAPSCTSYQPVWVEGIEHLSLALALVLWQPQGEEA